MNIAIASGKGGTGKTTLAVNLASFINSFIANNNGGVVLVDLDVEEPNSGLFFSMDLVNKKESNSEWFHNGLKRSVHCVENADRFASLMPLLNCQRLYCCFQTFAIRVLPVLTYVRNRHYLWPNEKLGY